MVRGLWLCHPLNGPATQRVASHLPGETWYQKQPAAWRRTILMSHITSMMETHPNPTSDLDVEKLADCIAACFECAQTCTACADACLAEEAVAHLRNCIRLDVDCAGSCTATGHILSRRTGQDRATVKAVLEACRMACAECATECEQHGEMHERCLICAEAC